MSIFPTAPAIEVLAAHRFEKHAGEYFAYCRCGWVGTCFSHEQHIVAALKEAGYHIVEIPKPQGYHVPPKDIYTFAGEED